MRFILRMALRETRAAWKRLLFFFACLALGVAAIVTLRSVIESVRLVMTGEAVTRWWHRVAKTRRPAGLRVNLTFRHMVADA